MTLQDKLDAFKAEFESGQLPFTLTEQEHALMRKAIQTQIAAGIAERALKVGDAAPGFTLSDCENRSCSSAALLAKGPLVVSFYRGIWCPYCTLDLQALQATLPAITQYGAQLVAVSPQSAVHNRRAMRDHDLTFALLSDAGNRLAAQFGLRYRLPDALIALYQQRLGLDLAQFNQMIAGRCRCRRGSSSPAMAVSPMLKRTPITPGGRSRRRCCRCWRDWLERRRKRAPFKHDVIISACCRPSLPAAPTRRTALRSGSRASAPRLSASAPPCALSWRFPPPCRSRCGY